MKEDQKDIEDKKEKDVLDEITLKNFKLKNKVFFGEFLMI